MPGRTGHGDVVVLWNVAPSAPVSAHAAPDGCALLVGDALPKGQARRVAAVELWDDWTVPGRSAAVYDGFFAGIGVRGGHVVIGGDILGLFPIYYASRGELLVAGSSSAAFGSHPQFHDALDLHALFGHLLTGGPFDGRTLRQGVSRLQAGSLLRWSAERSPREVSHYTLPVAQTTALPTFDNELERFDEALQAAVRRHTGVHPAVSLLLSGGRDSRLLAGYVSRDRRAQGAITLGAPTDHDASCASRVAGALGVPHSVHEIPSGDFAAHADRNVRWEGLAGGMSAVHTWGSSEALRASGGAVVSGYLLEIRQIAPLPPTRAGMLAWTYAHAMTPARLRTLVTRGHERTVDEVTEAITARLDSARNWSINGGAHADDMPDPERSWQWFARVYVRFHAGAVPWRLSFSAWPILPILDQDLLDVMLSIPPSFLANRRLEDALLQRRFPNLARLPLDRNSNNVRPLSPSLWYRLRARTQDALPSLSRPVDGLERRYYVRIYNFDNSGWRAIRRAAEPGRSAMGEWFRGAALAAFVPPPEESVAHADVIAQGFAPKMLVGFMRLAHLRTDARS